MKKYCNFDWEKYTCFQLEILPILDIKFPGFRSALACQRGFTTLAWTIADIFGSKKNSKFKKSVSAFRH
jgi:hypothetical protein